MKISIVTVTKNSAKTLTRTVLSVATQLNVEVEHLIKDAGSTDDTIGIAKAINNKIVVVAKPDKGIYDAMNQGFSATSGDIISFLNSDDYYPDENVLSEVLHAFQNISCDFVYGNITMISSTGELVREWKTGEINELGLVAQQIPHPCLFVRRDVLVKLEMPFDPTYKISADLKQQLIIINKFKSKGMYLNRSLVIMETGGESTNSFRSYWLGWKESLRAYNEVFGRGGLWFVVQKVLSKFKGLQLRAQIRNFGK